MRGRAWERREVPRRKAHRSIARSSSTIARPGRSPGWNGPPSVGPPSVGPPVSARIRSRRSCQLINLEIKFAFYFDLNQEAVDTTRPDGNPSSVTRRRPRGRPAGSEDCRFVPGRSPAPPDRTIGRPPPRGEGVEIDRCQLREPAAPSAPGRSLASHLSTARDRAARRPRNRDRLSPESCRRSASTSRTATRTTRSTSATPSVIRPPALLEVTAQTRALDRCQCWSLTAPNSDSGR